MIVLSVLTLIFAFFAFVFVKILGKEPVIDNDEKDKELQRQISVQNDYEQIKLEIATGRRSYVPAELNKTREIVILEYLNDCYHLRESKQQIKCYEEYYLGSDNSMRQQKLSCEGLNGEDMISCMDQFYLALAIKTGRVFCGAVQDQEINEECVGKTE